MTTASFTPGPWHEGQGNGEGHIFCKEGRYRNGTLYSICRVTEGFDPAEDAANARLLAAAPDGYDLLSALAEWFEGGAPLSPDALYDENRTWRQAVAAYLSKTGRRES